MTSAHSGKRRSGRARACGHQLAVAGARGGIPRDFAFPFVLPFAFAFAFAFAVPFAVPLLAGVGRLPSLAYVICLLSFAGCRCLFFTGVVACLDPNVASLVLFIFDAVVTWLRAGDDFGREAC